MKLIRLLGELALVALCVCWSLRGSLTRELEERLAAEAAPGAVETRTGEAAAGPAGAPGGGTSLSLDLVRHRGPDA
jgi:hypothetical protein